MTQTTLDDLKFNFDMLGDWEERFTYLLDLGHKLPAMDEADKVESNRVHGCQSTVYLKPIVHRNGETTIEFQAESDAHIVNGLIAILKMLFDRQTPETVLETDEQQVFGELGLLEHLSPTRRNGLSAMIRRMREVAETVKRGEVV